MYLSRDQQDEVSDGLPQSSGGIINPKVEEVATDVLAASAAYSSALGKSHDSEGERGAPKKRWADAPSVQNEQEDYLNEEPLDEEPLEPAAAAAKDKEAIQQCLDNLDQVAEFVKHVYTPSNERVVTLYVNDDEEGVKYILPPWADSPATGKCILCERRKETPNYQELPRPIKCGHCIGSMQIAAEVSTPLDEAEVDINVLEAARKHIHVCKKDFELRNSMPGTEASSTSTDPRINETFGFGHKAFEGFWIYEESLRKVLIEEMIFLKKNALIGEAPIPPNLREEKRKESALELFPSR